MTFKKTLLLPLIAATACFAASSGAEEDAMEHVERKYVIAVKTDDFELAETDVSALAVGESQTIVTDVGKTVDVLRTESGFELYVDGVLQDMNFGDYPDDGTGGWQKEIEIICSHEEPCDDLVWVSADEDAGLEHIAAHGEAHVVRRTIRTECTDEATCEEHHVRIAEDSEAIHLGGTEGGVRIIRLHEQRANGDNGEPEEKVIVIRKKAEHD